MNRTSDTAPLLRARTWRHPSVRALRETYGKEARPEQIIRELARELIQYAHRFGWSGPPYDPRVLASILDIRVGDKNLATGMDGLLYVDHKGDLKILVDKRTPKSRQNFTICHEIAHTFFPDHFDIVRMRQKTGMLEDHHWELEKLCNLGASELLMPMDRFARDVVYHGFSLRSVDTLKDLYRASPEAVARRMILTGLETSCAVFLRCIDKPSSEKRQVGGSSVKPGKKMRVEYAVPSMDFHCFIPRFKSVPAYSCVNQALFSKDVVAAIENWGLRGAPLFRVEARAHPINKSLGHEERRVTAFLFPSYF